MKPFLILRVPATLSVEKTTERRTTFGARPESVGEAETEAEASRLVAAHSFGDFRHHYYALELKFMGAPDRKSAIAVPAGKPAKGARPKLVSRNEEKENRA